jgi:hypothetical protein
MIFKQDYYGYVYEWTNSVNGMKYIGSHYGSVEDYYRGSGKRFKPAYLKSPENFSMQVLEYVSIDDKKLLLNIEQKWLNSVHNIRHNPKYYNLNNFSLGGSSHITRKHIVKRSETLVKKHKDFGLSEAEITSYKTKIQTRLDRISNSGFTDKEKLQHASYGYTVKIISKDGIENIFNSCAVASKFTGIDVQYGIRVCKTKNDFKGFKCIKIADPIKDCRS